MKGWAARWLRWVPALLVAGGIFMLSSLRGQNVNPFPVGAPEKSPGAVEGAEAARKDDFDEVDFVIKKAAHMVEFGLLAYALEFGFNQDSRKTRVMVCALVVLYGISDEIHQSFVPGRTPKAADVLIDFLAAVLVVNRRAILDRVLGVGKRKKAY